MNCQRFDDIIKDVAREQIMDATLRHEAFRHIGECPTCAARLNDEQALTHQLQDFALTTKSMSAPQRVEAHLLEAFDSKSLVSRQPIRRASVSRYWLAAVAAQTGASRVMWLGAWSAPGGPQTTGIPAQG